MAQNIILKRSSLPGKVPDTSSLNTGEIAINTYDGKLFIKKSGNVDSIQSVLTTNSITTGSIILTETGSFAELLTSQDANIGRDLYVIRDIITNNDIDAGGDISGSGLQVNDTLNVTHEHLRFTGSAELTGSIGVSGDLNVIGAINARQFNIGIISSSVIYQSGSTKFGDTIDDSHQFTGSLLLTGSLIVNGEAVGVAPGPNTYDFNLDPNAAGTVNFIEDSTGNTQAISQIDSFNVQIANTNYLSVSSSAMWVTTGSITSNYMHLAKYISTTGDLDFNI
jgi:ethanolamine utilization microcompartment shell protein EutS